MGRSVLIGNFGFRILSISRVKGPLVEVEILGISGKRSGQKGFRMQITILRLEVFILQFHSSGIRRGSGGGSLGVGPSIPYTLK